MDRSTKRFFAIVGTANSFGITDGDGFSTDTVQLKRFQRVAS